MPKFYRGGSRYSFLGLVLLFSCITDHETLQPKADFSFSSENNFFELSTVKFTNESINAGVYNWNFGDISTSYTINPTHTYQKAGKYNVVLIASNGGKRSQVTKEIIIFTRPFVTMISPTSGPVGTSVVITGTGFDPVRTNNMIKFNGISSVITACSTTSITTTVPAGATTGKVVVTVDGLEIQNQLVFSVL